MTPCHGILTRPCLAQTEGETRPCKFSQVFHLMPAGASWFVFNDMFRLNYG